MHKKGNPYRSIVNGKCSHTERITEVVEKELESYVLSTPSDIKDTIQFLQHLQTAQQPLPEEKILFVFTL